MNAFEIVINCIIALGSLATVGTFIKMIHVGRKQDQRIKRLEEQHIDALYKPNLRIDNYGTNNYGCSLALKNYGNDIIIRSILSTPSEWLNRDKIETWFPFHLEAGGTIVLPLVGKNEMFQEGTIYLTTEDKLGRAFKITISSVNNKFMISKVERVEKYT